MTNWNYNLNIPNPPNQPSQDVPLMQTNTNNINNLISVDHVGFNANNGGYHTVIHQIPQSSDPGMVTGISQLYSKTVNSVPELFFENDTGVVSQLTGSLDANRGYQWIGGVLLQWGIITTPLNGHKFGTVTLPIAFSSNFFNASVSLIATSSANTTSDNTLAIVTGTPNLTSFQWVFNGNSTVNFNSFYWMAIGK